MKTRLQALGCKKSSSPGICNYKHNVAWSRITAYKIISCVLEWNAVTFRHGDASFLVNPGYSLWWVKRSVFDL